MPQWVTCLSDLDELFRDKSARFIQLFIGHGSHTQLPDLIRVQYERKSSEGAVDFLRSGERAYAEKGEWVQNAFQEGSTYTLLGGACRIRRRRRKTKGTRRLSRKQGRSRMRCGGRTRSSRSNESRERRRRHRKRRVGLLWDARRRADSRERLRRSSGPFRSCRDRWRRYRRSGRRPSHGPRHWQGRRDDRLAAPLRWSRLLRNRRLRPRRRPRPRERLYSRPDRGRGPTASNNRGGSGAEERRRGLTAYSGI